MEISVIVPTYNRYKILLEVLESLKNQSLDKKKYEVIVVSDGSTDKTSEVVKKFIRKNKDIKIKFIELKKGIGVWFLGVSRARNVAIKKAVGRILVIIGDDIICPKDFLKSHLEAHKVKSIAVTGAQIWTDKPNEYMNLLIDNENLAKRKGCVGTGGFCTANVSIERKWLVEEKFDESIGMGFEDTELGYRLIKRGVKMIYDPKTWVYHKHHYTLEDFRKRQKMYGKVVPLLINKHPELKNEFVPKYRKLKRAVCKVLIPLGIFQHINPKFYAKMESLVNYVDGIEEGVKEFNIRL